LQPAVKQNPSRVENQGNSISLDAGYNESLL
jgi:hypothetical protein